MTRIKKIRFAAAALLSLASLAAAAQSPQRLPQIPLQAGMHRVQAQVAQSDEQRATGLMHVREMPQHEGMLFVFEQAGQQCFWMRNTLIPLSIAFLRDDGSIVNIAEMKALDDKSNHCSAEPVRYALEMNAGWFAKRGLKSGSKLQRRAVRRRALMDRWGYWFRRFALALAVAVPALFLVQWFKGHAPASAAAYAAGWGGISAALFSLLGYLRYRRKPACMLPRHPPQNKGG